MIEKSILFLDEFQLSDRAANKILNNLLTTLFQLAGILVASSNRTPKVGSGVEFAPPPRGLVGIGWV
jgi:protein AFG1